MLRMFVVCDALHAVARQWCCSVPLRHAILFFRRLNQENLHRVTVDNLGCVLIASRDVSTLPHTDKCCICLELFLWRLWETLPVETDRDN